MATSSSAVLLCVDMEAVNYGLMSSALATFSSSVLLFVQRPYELVSSVLATSASSSMLLFVHTDRTDYRALFW